MSDQTKEQVHDLSDELNELHQGHGNVLAGPRRRESKWKKLREAKKQREEDEKYNRGYGHGV